MPVNVKHGGSANGKRTPEYEAWIGMLGRCRAKPGTRAHKYYGGRGITVCQRWQDSFIDFLKDVGQKPGPEYSLDRKDNKKNYEPGNVRWATQKQQLRNSRRARMITFNNETMCINDWADRIGLDFSALIRRIDKWGVEKAITTPVLAKFRNSKAGTRVKK